MTLKIVVKSNKHLSYKCVNLYINSHTTKIIINVNYYLSGISVIYIVFVYCYFVSNVMSNNIFYIQLNSLYVLIERYIHCQVHLIIY